MRLSGLHSKRTMAIEHPKDADFCVSLELCHRHVRCARRWKTWSVIADCRRMYFVAADIPKR